MQTIRGIDICAKRLDVLSSVIPYPPTQNMTFENAMLFVEEAYGHIYSIIPNNIPSNSLTRLFMFYKIQKKTSIRCKRAYFKRKVLREKLTEVCFTLNSKAAVVGMIARETPLESSHRLVYFTSERVENQRRRLLSVSSAARIIA